MFASYNIPSLPKFIFVVFVLHNLFQRTNTHTLSLSLDSSKSNSQQALYPPHTHTLSCRRHDVILTSRGVVSKQVHFSLSPSLSLSLSLSLLSACSLACIWSAFSFLNLSLMLFSFIMLSAKKLEIERKKKGHTQCERGRRVGEKMKTKIEFLVRISF